MAYEKLADKLNMEEIHMRLVNWGNWLRWDSTIARLGYPDQSPFVFSPRRGQMIADLDAIHIEWIVSTMYISRQFSPMGHLYAFILRVEYAERSDSSARARAHLADDVSRRFKIRCAERTFRHHLLNAKKTLAALAGPIK